MRELKEAIKLEIVTHSDGMVTEERCINQIINLCKREAIAAVMSLPARGDMRRMAIQALERKFK